MLLKVPPETLALHATVPVDALFVPLVSLTVAVNVIVFPMVTVAGLGVTPVDVVCRLTVSDDMPELLAWEPSPE